MENLADENIDFFGLEARFGKIYLNTVKTYDKVEFEDKFVNKYCKSSSPNRSGKITK
ncbi:hypothetical protein [Desulfonispora thiosulfatigenes]|uniref:hypothetical protein n=1 Tax=Desulfonispora thiosulfatigenes TaxID=83661 RepID=UPI001356442D|nr:hypothetical protein [Desulfonispora thiosulfatigenes]